MQLRNVFIVGKREYVSRIKTKGFWIATISVPVLLGAMLVLPSLIMSKTRAVERLAVVDTTGRVGSLLEAELAEISRQTFEQARFEVELLAPEADESAQRAALDRRVLDDELTAWVWISPAGLEGDRIEYHAESVSNFLTQQTLQGGVTKVVRAIRLAEAGYDVDAIAQLSRPIGLETVRISEEGSRAEGGAGGFILAIGLFFMIYVMIFIYGSQVMLGVLEEKSSRVVEVMLSVVKPLELMTGKLLGICGIGLTQLAVWLGTAAALLSPGVVALTFLPEGVVLPTLPPALVLHTMAYFLLAFFLYASFYAMVGAAFNNQQDAQQMAMIAVPFVVAPALVLAPIINDPDSALSVGMSLFPAFTPLVMVLRMAVKMPPAWQIALSYLLTVAACVALTWLAARIYRVGILMYGKKPSPQELWRWIRHRAA